MRSLVSQVNADPTTCAAPFPLPALSFKHKIQFTKRAHVVNIRLHFKWRLLLMSGFHWNTDLRLLRHWCGGKGAVCWRKTKIRRNGEKNNGEHILLLCRKPGFPWIWLVNVTLILCVIQPYIDPQPVCSGNLFHVAVILIFANVVYRILTCGMFTHQPRQRIFISSYTVRGRE